MKIGVISEALFKNEQTHAKACEKIKKIGYDCLDYSLFGGWATPSEIFSKPRQEWVNYFKEERKIIENEGLSVSQTHAVYRSDFDPDHLHEFTPMVVEQLKKEIEATALLGSKYIIIHPINLAVLSKNKDRDLEVNIKEFSKITPTLKEFGVKNGVEDMFTWDSVRARACATGCSTDLDMVKYIDAMNDRDAYCACLDTGHMLIHSIDPARAVRTLGDRLEVLHVHDNNGLSDQHLPIGFGVTDWKELVKALREVNYKGVFSLEIGFEKFAKMGCDAMWKMAEYSYVSAKNVLEDID